MDLDNDEHLDCANNQSTLAGLAKTCRHRSGGHGGLMQLGRPRTRRSRHRRTSIATVRNRWPLELSETPSNSPEHPG
eukprot:12112104-Alexandrium_andersonii.AAC.1